MASKQKQRTELQNATVSGAQLATGRASALSAAGVVQTQKTLVPRRMVFTLTNAVVTVAAASDFGSIILGTLPTGTCIILSALANLTATGTLGVDTPANIDFGLGTAAASASTLATTMINIMAKVDCTAGGLIQSSVSSSSLAVAGTTPSVFLNIADVISADGTVVLNGRIELTYLDVGDSTV